MHIDVIKSDVRDPYWNLAWEDAWLDRAGDAPPCLLLWRSRPAVVIGKNQQPWRECDPTYLEQEDIQLARRVSGGGAVYHDEGNLNYAFFLPRTAYAADQVFDWISRILAGLGVAVSRLNRTGLAVDGLKVSGNAFCYRRQTVLHHGTLLVHAKLDRLRRALRPLPGEWETRATPSVRSPVTNLQALGSHLTMEAVIAAFYQWAGQTEHKEAAAFLPAAELRRRVALMRSDTWLYNHSPPAAWTAPDGVRWCIEAGLVKQVDSAVAEDQAWAGRPFREMVRANRGVLGCGAG